VEKHPDGNQEINNRQLTVDYGSNGIQTVNLTVENWRDPIVVAESPAAGATNVAVDTTVTITWSQRITTPLALTLTGPGGPVAGTKSLDPTQTVVTFTPAAELEPGAVYTVTVSGQVDEAGDVQQAPMEWSFTTLPADMVQVTFNVQTPPFTPGGSGPTEGAGDVVYISGNVPELGNGDPAGLAMTHVATDTWSVTVAIAEGTEVLYHYTRGSVETEEVAADGNSPVSERQLVVDGGGTGAQSANDTVANWQDPLVVATLPANGDSNVPVDSAIRVTWNQAMAPTSDFTVVGPDGVLTGTFAYEPASFTVVFTPSVYLRHTAAYTVTVAGEVDANGVSQQAPVEWGFNTFVPTAVTTADFEVLAPVTVVEMVVWGASLLVILVCSASLVILLYRRRTTL
jgi:hypothetical protein